MSTETYTTRRDLVTYRTFRPSICPARPPCDCDHGGDYTYPACGVAFGYPCTCDHPCQAHETEYVVTHRANRVDPECGFDYCINCHEEV